MTFPTTAFCFVCKTALNFEDDQCNQNISSSFFFYLLNNELTQTCYSAVSFSYQIILSV